MAGATEAVNRKPYQTGRPLSRAAGSGRYPLATSQGRPEIVSRGSDSRFPLQGFNT